MRFATIRTDGGTTAARLDGDVLTLRPGNVLRAWIEGPGECLNHCVAEKAG